jgi:hypothetical protein
MLKIIEKVFNSVKCKLAQLNSTLSWANLSDFTLPDLFRCVGRGERFV